MRLRSAGLALRFIVPLGLGLALCAYAVVPLVETMLTPARRGTTEESIREWAASTLGPLQDPRAVAPLLAVLRDPAAPEMLRAGAAVSLAKLDAREAIPDLRKMAADRSAHLEYRKAAVGAIGELNDGTIGPLPRFDRNGSPVAGDILLTR